ncbi:MAG: serine/threonine-protein phosphatase [Nocardioidaceae bacterium]|nr:serine/threonine-protein phosphatase [Nocardioidaceae bacterium]NUS50084.1 serine/threonine-protein phosphatase [Nocardioidaceae bacterium]
MGASRRRPLGLPTVVAAPQSDRLSGLPAGRALTRRWNRTVRRLRESELDAVLLLGALCVLCGVASVASASVPLTTLVLPMVVGNLVLGPRTLPWLVVFALAVMVVVVALTPTLLDERRIGGIVVIFLIGLVILVSSFRRTRLGVAGVRGESMLVDLRDRIQHQTRIPALPSDWDAEVELRSAGGSSFAGDFMVAARSRDGSKLQVAVVDVSGKGEQAGSRSLLLSGAFAGLLNALTADDFLPAANDYLLRQDWSEGFATAVHLFLDLRTGGFELRSAGHPPGVQLLAGSGRWVVHEPEGPVLGLANDASFSVVRGQVNRGDALLLFTDGLVETPQRDIMLGIDRLLGQSERLLRGGFRGGARRLIDRMESYNDDRLLLLLHRR